MAKFINLTGRSFGRLVVIRRAENRNNKPAWLCQCSCGNNKIIAGNSLRSGLTTSCGCYRSQSLSERRRSDLTGQIFGRLSVVRLAGIDKDQHTAWLCKCACGKEKVIIGKSLTCGLTTSCGCYHRELVSDMFKGRTDYSGENNPNYKPEKTYEERMDDRSYPEYKEWRKLVFEKYNYTCVICGSKDIQAHHIEDYSSNPELRTNVDNGIVLCGEHHRLFHSIYGIKTNNREQLHQFLEGGCNVG